jgi:hypothetical protein
MRRFLRFGVRDLLWLTLVVAVALADSCPKDALALAHCWWASSMSRRG